MLVGNLVRSFQLSSPLSSQSLRPNAKCVKLADGNYQGFRSFERQQTNNKDHLVCGRPELTFVGGETLFSEQKKHNLNLIGN